MFNKIFDWYFKKIFWPYFGFWFLITLASDQAEYLEYWAKIGHPLHKIIVASFIVLFVSSVVGMFKYDKGPFSK